MDLLRADKRMGLTKHERKIRFIGLQTSPPDLGKLPEKNPHDLYEYHQMQTFAPQIPHTAVRDFPMTIGGFPLRRTGGGEYGH